MAAGTGVRPYARAPMAAPPPSFLVLMADQLAASWLPVYGHPVVQAPHLTALAAGAAVFDSAYCAYPLCAPSRAAMLTGRHASSVGVYDNAAELPATTPTVVHALRAAGYHTAVAGKMHFVGPDQLHGFEERLTTDIYPVRRRLDAGLEPPARGAAALVSHDGERPEPGRDRGQHADRL